MLMASETSVMPRAERWRRPKDFGMDISFETGRMQPAAMIWFLSTIMAPSCSGVFLKKIVSMSCCEKRALISSPVAIYSFRPTLREMTMSAPVLDLDIDSQDLTIELMNCEESDSWSEECSWSRPKRRRKV